MACQKNPREHTRAIIYMLLLNPLPKAKQFWGSAGQMWPAGRILCMPDLYLPILNANIVQLQKTIKQLRKYLVKHLYVKRRRSADVQLLSVCFGVLLFLWEFDYNVYSASSALFVSNTLVDPITWLILLHRNVGEPKF